jgi:hypothetical protein
MGKNKITGETQTSPAEAGLPTDLECLGLPFMRDNYDMLANRNQPRGRPEPFSP